MTPPEHLTVRGPEDILGFIPHSLGYWPADSLVAMTMQGKRLGATLRLDLPGPETLADPWGYARTVRDYLEADQLADGALLAVFTNDGWMEPPGTYSGLLGALEDVLDSAGLTVRDAWFVGDAYWRDAHCTDQDCCPFPGRPVQAIRDSMLNAEMVYRGSSVGPAPAEASHPRSPVADAERDVVLASEAAWAAQLERRRGSEEQFCRLMVHWEALLANPPAEPLAAQDVAYLRASLAVPAWRDAVLVMAAAGRPAAVTGAAAFGIFDAGCTLEPVGPAHSEREHPEPAPGDGSGIPGYGEVLLGREPVLPAWSRLNSLDQVLEQLWPCGGTAGAAALTGQGWIAWCRGRGSYAAAYLGRALEEEPGYRLAELLLELVRRGTLCGWAARKEASWRRFEPDAA
ncbi:DUF4192 domain-containing protein [Pseudarthrobacter sp. DSP2-3-2b1]|uniref:DUF4192 domain-containing protein n=1 Tax=Pseudarthrobacter sp. DSP2-3-2b1 TaxID=2804661 RepID=UPI003CEFC22F